MLLPLPLHFSTCSYSFPSFPFHRGCYLLICVPVGKNLHRESWLNLSLWKAVPRLAFSWLKPMVPFATYPLSPGLSWEKRNLRSKCKNLKRSKSHLRTKSPTEQRWLGEWVQLQSLFRNGPVAESFQCREITQLIVIRHNFYIELPWEVPLWETKLISPTLWKFTVRAVVSIPYF